MWDKGGQPKKIEIEIKTVPFEMDRRLKNRLTLAYLNSGPSSLFSFNQKPSWKKFSLDWTKLQTSQIGVQLTNPKTGENSYRILNTKESFWSFYHLLFRAKQIEKGLWKWKIPLADSGISSPQVELSIKENPWNIFRLRN